MNRRKFLDSLLGLLVGFNLPQTELPRTKFHLLENIMSLSLYYEREIYIMENIDLQNTIDLPESGSVTICIKKEDPVYDIHDVIKIPGVETLFKIYFPSDCQNWYDGTKLVTYDFKPIEEIK